MTVTNEWLALAIFLVAAGTDLLDGYLARRWKQVTTIGTLLDPIADKLLVSAALISLVQVRALPGWMAMLIIGREFAVSGLRSIAAAEGYTIRASDLGKTKMFSQVVAVSVMLLSVRHPALHTAGMVLMWGVVFFALVSAVSYFRKFWRKVDESVKNRRRRELLTLERKRQRALRRQRRSSGSSADCGRLGRHNLEAARSELNRPHLPLRPTGPIGLPFNEIVTPPALPRRSVTFLQAFHVARMVCGSMVPEKTYLPSARASTQTGFLRGDLDMHGGGGIRSGVDAGKRAAARLRLSRLLLHACAGAAAGCIGRRRWAAHR